MAREIEATENQRVRRTKNNWIKIGERKMGIIKGDIRRALGFGSFKIGELEIDLSKTTAKDIIDFQELPIKALSGKKQEDLVAEDLLKLSADQLKWYVDYFFDKDPEVDKSEVELLVVKNKRLFHRGFTIGFGIKTQEKYDADEKKAEDDMEKEAEKKQ